MNKSIILRTAAALSISAALLCGAASCGISELVNIPITTYTVEHTDVENYISVSGTVEGSNIVKVTSDVVSKVKTLNVGVGSSVKKGDVLCVFDTADYQEQYDKLKQTADNTGERMDNIHSKNVRALEEAKKSKTDSLNRAQRAINNAVSARDSAYAKYNQLGADMNTYYGLYSDAYDSGDTDSAEYYLKLYESTKEQYEMAGTSLSSYDTAVQEARDAYGDVEKQADEVIRMAQETIDDEKYNKDTTVQDQLDALQEKIDACTVKSPKDGIVTALSVAEGSVATSEAIMTIEDTSELRINVKIQEADILKVKEGQKAIITTTATGEEEFTGKVERVVNIMSGQMTNAFTGEVGGGGYSAEIVIDKGADKLLIGMTAKAKIILDKKENVLAVPYDSIMEKEDGSYCVFIAEKNGDKGYKAKEIPVEKGMETNYLTEIIATELKDGDIILTEVAMRGVVDGGEVTIAEPYTDPDTDKGE